MQTDEYDKNNHQSKEEYGRTAPQMSHCGRSWVVLRGTEDLKEEEVQVHPGITNRGCLASTCRHPLTSTHKHTRTLALTSSHTQSAWANVSPLLQVNPFTRPRQLKTKFSPPAKLRPDHNWVCALNWVYWILLYCCTFIVCRVLAVQLRSVVPHVFICLIPGDDLNKYLLCCETSTLLMHCLWRSEGVSLLAHLQWPDTAQAVQPQLLQLMHSSVIRAKTSCGPSSPFWVIFL